MQDLSAVGQLMIFVSDYFLQDGLGSIAPKPRARSGIVAWLAGGGCFNEGLICGSVFSLGRTQMVPRDTIW